MIRTRLAAPLLVLLLALSACSSEDLDLLLETLAPTDFARSQDAELARTAKILAEAERKAEAELAFETFELAIRQGADSLPEARDLITKAVELDPDNPTYIARKLAFDAMSGNFGLFGAELELGMAEISARTPAAETGNLDCLDPISHLRLRTAMADVLNPDGGDVVAPGPDSPAEYHRLYATYVTIPNTPIPPECLHAD